MANERTGHGVVLKVNTGTVGSPTWTAVASQRGVSITPSADMIDVSSKEAVGRAYLPGHRSWTIRCDSLYIKSGVDYAKLLAAYEADDDDSRKIQVMWTEDSTNYRWIYAFITSMPHEFPDADAATLSVELQATGDWTAA